jgi:catechol 2,3-dioxygenase-like lactoylglutathione lyase family enzyme
MIRGIHHVAIHVKDFDGILKFYKEAFGFVPTGDEVKWEKNPVLDSIIGLKDSAARTVMLKAGTCYIEVFEYFAPKPREAGAARPSDRGYTHFCVDVTDIEAEYKRLQACGMRFFNPVPVDVGIVKTVYGQDPEGNVIEIQQTSGSTEFEMKELNKGLTHTRA